MKFSLNISYSPKVVKGIVTTNSLFEDSLSIIISSLSGNILFGYLTLASKLDNGFLGLSY